MIKFLITWQTLIGSFIGGLVGLFSAWIVAYYQRRRDENASAMLLISDLVIFKEKAEASLKISPDLKSDKAKFQVLLNLLKLSPSLSSMFDGSMMRIMSVDNKLAAHLTHFRMFYNDISQILNRLKTLYEKGFVSQLSSDSDIINDLDVMIKGLKNSIIKAEFSTYLLEELLLNSYSWWTRRILFFRRKYRPTKIDIESENNLKLINKSS